MVAAQDNPPLLPSPGSKGSSRDTEAHQSPPAPPAAPGSRRSPGRAGRRAWRARAARALAGSRNKRKGQAYLQLRVHGEVQVAQAGEPRERGRHALEGVVGQVQRGQAREPVQARHAPPRERRRRLVRRAVQVHALPRQHAASASELSVPLQVAMTSCGMQIFLGHDQALASVQTAAAPGVLLPKNYPANSIEQQYDMCARDSTPHGTVIMAGQEHKVLCTAPGRLHSFLWCSASPGSPSSGSAGTPAQLDDISRDSCRVSGFKSRETKPSSTMQRAQQRTWSERTEREVQ